MSRRPNTRQRFTVILLFLPILASTAAAAAVRDLLPRPAAVLETEGFFPLEETLTIGLIGAPGGRLVRAAERFLERLSNRTGLFLRRDDAIRPGGDGGASLVLRCAREGALIPGEDESYRLTVSPDRILVVARTDLGVLHGLETVLQLLAAGPQGYRIPCVQIEDAPRFPWRGLLIDSGRHFQPVEVIKRTLDGMAVVKMNVLHWHLTDDQGFRVESRAFPDLHRLGSDGRYYSQAQIRGLVAYAADRGIRIMPEFDLPSHATSWFVSYPELASAPGPYRISRTYGVLRPAFNPANPNVYAFLDAFFGEMTGLFPDPFIHIGGDENDGKDWEANPEIQDFRREKGLADNGALQAYFNTRLSEILKKHGRRMVGWDEILQPGLPADAVIHSWRGPASLVQAAKKGHAGILSSGYYLDLCYPASDHYLNDPLPAGTGLSAAEEARVLGGEAAMWSEFVSPETIDSRLWPRAAAVAERLWSPAAVRDVDDMYRRLDRISLLLEDHGLTHIKNPDMILRRLVNGTDIGPLRTLAAAVEPLKGYRRHALGKVKTTLAPLSRFVDAVPPESTEARLFRRTVETFLARRDGGSAGALRAALESWRMNHDLLKPLLDASPVLGEVEPLSQGLAEAAGIGLNAIRYLAGQKSGARPPQTEVNVWKNTLTGLKKPMADLELAFLPAVEKLVTAACGR